MPAFLFRKLLIASRGKVAIRIAWLLALALSVALNAPIPETKYGVFRM